MVAIWMKIRVLTCDQKKRITQIRQHHLITSAPHQRKNSSTSNLICNRLTYTTDILWTRVSKLEPTGAEAEITSKLVYKADLGWHHLYQIALRGKILVAQYFHSQDGIVKEDFNV
ncbi:hypothetical protein AVEN_125674-1 [Araneus ventricosus]|uniref:Uncharacterized protein n=1 Tax=Araneus ventricosus TaxID=182803 RepID=A0A4Y1ZM95_ARAVE|nr:hypothetical protein AVEN_125674-1 [Araneus ventricosus]